jgi:hypothetical protein
VLENGGVAGHLFLPERDVRMNYRRQAHVAVIIQHEQIGLLC